MGGFRSTRDGKGDLRNCVISIFKIQVTIYQVCYDNIDSDEDN